MTGYGRGTAERADARAVVEIRSVNHRFLDVKLRGGSYEPALEEQIARRVRAHVHRGAVTVTVRVERRGGEAGAFIDRDAAARVHRELQQLARSLGIDPATVGLDLVCAQPGVLVADEALSDEAAACALDAVDAALAALVQMREAEGARLRADLDARLSRLGELVSGVEGRAARAPAEAVERLRERLARLLDGSGVAVDDARLAQEVVFLADRLDVTEEVVRLRSHIEQLSQIMAGAGSIGRRMDFLVQELGRELNTITSKSQSAEIARAMVEGKAEVEKIREQVQNVE